MFKFHRAMCADIRTPLNAQFIFGDFKTFQKLWHPSISNNQRNSLLDGKRDRIMGVNSLDISIQRLTHYHYSGSTEFEITKSELTVVTLANLLFNDLSKTPNIHCRENILRNTIEVIMFKLIGDTLENVSNDGSRSSKAYTRYKWCFEKSFLQQLLAIFQLVGNRITPVFPCGSRWMW